MALIKANNTTPVQTKTVIQPKTITEDQLLTNNISMEDKIKLSIKISNILSPLLKDNNLIENINDKRYVKAEGWNTLGTLLGLSTVVNYVKLMEIKGYEIVYKAKVSIMRGDTIISSAEAIAVKNNKQSEIHAVYSMAQTRAMGKAYRMALSWIITLAGYEATPAEEMINIRSDNNE